MKNCQITLYSLVLGCAFFLSAPVFSAPEATEAKKEEKADSLPAKSENLIFSVATADFNGDKKPDSAILIRSEDQANLYIYLNNGKGGTELALEKKAVAWSGALAGTLPQLTTGKGGVLYIDSQNEAVGRARWHHRLTVDYRDNDFIVAGYSYDSRDTLEPEKNSFSCDVNLLTGKGTKNKENFKIDAQKIKLTDWSDDKTPKQCRN